MNKKVHSRLLHILRMNDTFKKKKRNECPKFLYRIHLKEDCNENVQRKFGPHLQ